MGRTVELVAERRAFYPPEEVVRQVETRVREVRARGDTIDYLAFVPDGEPTLDLHLGREITGLRSLGIPVAVISNAFLVDRSDVQSDLLRADWVSLKVDAVREETWRRVNRPHRRLRLADQLSGGLRFSRRFAGTLATETMLVGGLNDDAAHLDDLGTLSRGSRAGRGVPVGRRRGPRPRRGSAPPETTSSSGPGSSWRRGYPPRASIS